MSPSLTRIVRATAAVLLFGTGSYLHAQTGAAAAKIQVIPQPKQVTLGEGSFRLGRDTRLVLADSKSADDRFAAQDFIDDVKATADVALSIGKSRRDILVGRIDLPSIAQALKRNSGETSATLNQEGYLIVVNADHVIVAGNTTVGTFYGLQTLKQLVRGNGVSSFI